jgi:ABC-2 type transport system permease protein
VSVARTFRAYRLLMGAAMRSQLSFRANFFLVVIGGLLFQGVGLAFIWVVVERFGSIGGWTLAEVAFLYGIRLAAHGTFTVTLGPVFSIGPIVQMGEFDRFLVRPVNPFVQLIAWRFHLQVLADLLGGVVLLVAASTLVAVDWSVPAVAYLVAAVVGGALVEAAAAVSVSTLAFRFVSIRAIRVAVDDVFNTFGSYPLKIFPTAVKFALTFVFPLAFVAYLPASVLLDRTGELHVAPWLAAVAPLAGVVLFAAAVRLWHHQTRHYTSTGS